MQSKPGDGTEGGCIGGAEEIEVGCSLREETVVTEEIETEGDTRI